MKVHVKSGLILALCMVLAVSMLAKAQKPEPLPSTPQAPQGYVPTHWRNLSVVQDLEIEIGQSPSMVIDPRNNNVFISYIDATNHDLWVAKSVKSGGNCAWNGSLFTMLCELIDSTGDLGGLNTSIAFYPGTAGVFTSWLLGVSYYDATTSTLKYAEYAFNMSAGHFTWNTYNVHTLAGKAPGLYSSLKFNNLGYPDIAYSTGDGLHYASYPGSGSGDCGYGNGWNCQLVDQNVVGLGASMDLTYENSPRIAYFDNVNHYLKYAYFLGNGTGNCGSGNNWHCYWIDDNVIVRYVSLVAEKSASDYPRVAYHVTSANETEGPELRYAEQAGTSNCGSMPWYCEVVSGYAGSMVKGVSLAVTSFGVPVIAYQNDAYKPDGYGTLWYAYPDGAGIGNCGSGSRWICDIPGGIYLLQTGEAAQLSLTPDNRVYIATYQSSTSSNPMASLNLTFQELDKLFYLPLLMKGN